MKFDICVFHLFSQNISICKRLTLALLISNSCPYVFYVRPSDFGLYSQIDVSLCHCVRNRIIFCWGFLETPSEGQNPEGRICPLVQREESNWVNCDRGMKIFQSSNLPIFCTLWLCCSALLVRDFLNNHLDCSWSWFCTQPTGASGANWS